MQQMTINERGKYMRGILKRIIIYISLTIITTLIFTGCNTNFIGSTKNEDTANLADMDEEEQPVSGGAVRMFATKPDTLNPITSANEYAAKYLKLIFESMIKLDSNQQAQPFLAEKWKCSEDMLSWQFYLRKDVFWQDDMPLTADDVVFTVKTIQNMAINSIYKKNVENILDCTAVNKNTVKIVLKTPNSFTPEQMTFPIIPKHYFEGEDILLSEKNMKPIGTGPYKFLQYEEGKNIYFQANEKWWYINSENAESTELPYIKDIQVKIYDNPSKEISAFQNKEIDIAFVDDGQVSRYALRSDLTVKKYISNNYDYISFNLSNTLLSDKNLRQAIAYSIDKTDIINSVIPGDAVAADFPILPDTAYSKSNVFSYKADKNKAKEILLQNGYFEQDGLMYKSNEWGNAIPVTLELIVNSENTVRCKIADKISEELKKTGITLNVVKITWDELMQKINSKMYDMALIGCKITSVPDLSFMYFSAYTPAQVYQNALPAVNTSGYKNDNVDKILTQILIENDMTKKDKLYHDLKNIVIDELPYLGLYFYYDGVLYNKNIKGTLSPYIWDPMYDITKWYIPYQSPVE